MGADENGLGARLGPLLVTAVLARVSADRPDALAKPLPKTMARDLGDSKQLVSHADVRLGEAWARVLMGTELTRPSEILARASLESLEQSRTFCPEHLAAQCWEDQQETFSAPEPLLRRVQGHRAKLTARGVEIVAVRSSVVCTRRLNLDRARGQHRFVVDLHQMERLALSLRASVNGELYGVCGKVGGIADYSRFFGPLGGRLHAVLERSRAASRYRFPGLGELHFVRDADAEDWLVMLASLVGKYLRELLMARIARYYAPWLAESMRPSGYHDPITERFVQATERLRRARRIPNTCFEREREP
jgi:ribonuclease HII